MITAVLENSLSDLRKNYAGLGFRRKRKKRNVARPLDRQPQTPLVGGADAGNPQWRDFAPLRDKLLEQPDILIVNVVYPFDAELADLSPTRVLPSWPAAALPAMRRRSW